MEKALKVVQPIELTKIGKREISSYGFRVDLVKQHLEEHLLRGPSEKWCDVSCMAKTMFQRNTEANRKRIRERMGKTFRTLLDRHGVFMAISYDMTRAGRGRILACKMFEASEGSERQYAQIQLERMRRRRQITEELLVRAQSIIAIPGI